MLVYRVETEGGLGPYIGCGMDGPASDRHPMPWNDPGLGPQRDWPEPSRFGFHTLQSYLAWFDGFERRLNGMGCGVTMYEVADEHVVVGAKQLVFNPEKATRLARYTAAEALRMARELELKVAA